MPSRAIFQDHRKVDFEDLAGTLDALPGDRRDLRTGGASLAHQDHSGAPQVAKLKAIQRSGSCVYSWT